MIKVVRCKVYVKNFMDIERNARKKAASFFDVNPENERMEVKVTSIPEPYQTSMVELVAQWEVEVEVTLND